MFVVDESIVLYEVYIFILSISFFLKNKNVILTYYLIGIIINILICIILKEIIKQPKNNIDPNLFKLILDNGNSLVDYYGLSFDVYGLPSSKVQLISFALLYFLFKNDSIKLSVFYFIWFIIINVQLYSSNYYSAIQIIISVIIGLLTSYFFIIYSKNIIQGSLKERKDDNTPLYLTNV